MKLIYISILSFFLLSCGSSGNTTQASFPEYEKENNNTQINTDNNESNLTLTSSIHGRGVDGELAQATLFLDLNLNTKLDSNEPSTTTDDEGYYHLELDSDTLAHPNYINRKALLILEGGFDIRSKSNFGQTLKANLDGNTSIYITPLSTIIATLVELNTSLEDAKEEVASSFNLPKELLTKDPIKVLNEGDIRLYSASLKIHNVAKVIRHNAQDTNDSYYKLAQSFQERQNSSDSPIQALINNQNIEHICQNQTIRQQIIQKVSTKIDQELATLNNKELNESLVSSSIDIDIIVSQLELELKRCQSSELNISLEENRSLEYKIVRKILDSANYNNEQVIEEIAQLDGIDSHTTTQQLLELLKSDAQYSNIVKLLQSTIENTTTTGTSSLASNSELVIKRVRTSTWESGYCEEVKIFNSSSESKIWNVELEVVGSIYTLWNANYSHNNNVLYAYGVDFNRAISPQSHVSFGYCLNSTSPNTPSSNEGNSTGYSSDKLQVRESIKDDWGSGYCSDIVISNQSANDKLWKTSFQAQGKITEVWNAQYTQDSQTLRVEIQGVDYNQVIKAYGAVNIGYCASKEASTTTPKEEVNTPPMTTLSDEQSVEKDFELLTFDHIRALNQAPDNITSNLHLITLGDEGSHILWQSNHETLLSTGAVQRPPYGTGDSIVELQATLSKGEVSKIKKFELLIKALPQNISLDHTKYMSALDLSMSFYEAQRASGEFKRVLWRQAIAKGDGSDVSVNLEGGWFDAGDYVKFNLPMSYSVTMLNWSLIDNPNSYKDLNYAKEQVSYALDYLARSYYSGKSGTYSDDRVFYQVGDGNIDHSFWGPPQDMSLNRPTSICSGVGGGCAAVSGSMAASFASGYILFKTSDATFANNLLKQAKEIYAFAKAYPTDDNYQNANPFYQLYDDNKDQLAWGAVWLYLATQDEDYLDDAKSFIANKSPIGWVHSWDNVTQGVVLLLARLTNDNTYHTPMQQSIDHWINNVPSSPAGLRVISQWGSLRYASSEAFIAAKYASITSDETQKSHYLNFAKSQIDYILGDNPLNFSYQIGFGSNYPLNPHHRASHDSPTHNINSPTLNTHTLIGALVGGPLTPNDYDYKDDREDYKRNEVATDYNAGFSAALAELIATKQ